MSELKRKRFERLHAEFDDASGHNRRLRYIAATGIRTCPEWPLVPHPNYWDANHYGLAKSHWLGITGKPTGTLCTPIGGSQWLLIGGELWEGAFYFDGPDENPTNKDPGSLQRQYQGLLRAKELFEELATEAAGFLPSIKTPHPLVDHPRRPELRHRWLESLCSNVEVEPAGAHAFDSRRLPGNVFQASALHLEYLEKQSGKGIQTIDLADAGQAISAFQQFLADAREREARELTQFKAEAKQENLLYEKQLRTLKELQNEIDRTFRQRLIDAGFTEAELAKGIAFLALKAGDPRASAFHDAMLEYRRNWALMVEFLNELAKPAPSSPLEPGKASELVPPQTPSTNDRQKDDQPPIPQRLIELAEAIEAGKIKGDGERLTDADRRQLRIAMEKAAEKVWHIDRLNSADFQDWGQLIVEFVESCRAAQSMAALDEAIAHFAASQNEFNLFAAELLRQVIDHGDRSAAAATLRLASNRGFLPRLRESLEGLCERAVAPRREQKETPEMANLDSGRVEDDVVAEGLTPTNSVPDAITKKQAANLVGVSKSRMDDVMSKFPPPKPEIDMSGKPKVWSFATLRPWLVARWPQMNYRMGSYDEAKEFFDKPL